MHRAGFLAVLAVLVGPTIRAGVAQAEGRFQVEPTQIDLARGAPSGALTIANHGTTALRLQASAFRWTESADGVMQLAAAPEIIVRPTLFEVAPGKARTLRVGTTASESAVEQSYRVFIEELPDRSAPQATGIHVLTRIGVPVFFAPRERRVAIDVKPADHAGRAAVIVRNTGTLHVKLAAVKLRAAAGELGADGWYVLPGASRRFVVAPDRPCATSDRWIAEATASDGTRWTSSPGPCEP